jgi:CheY-like chemotaxis protein
VAFGLDFARHFIKNLGTMMGSRDVHVLLAGGTADEVHAVEEVFKTAHSPTRVHLRHLTDLEQALPCLRGEGPFRKAFPASLLLLDVDASLDGARGLLSKLKGDDKLAHIPVVMLATHQSETELGRAYDQGVNCCVGKPVDSKELMRTLEATNAFWLTVAKLPSE